MSFKGKDHATDAELFEQITRLQMELEGLNKSLCYSEANELGKLLTAVGQVWAIAIAFIPLQGGFGYLMAVADLFSRLLLSGRISYSPDTEFCLDDLEMALAAGRSSEICHSDQACQFSSSIFVAMIAEWGDSDQLFYKEALLRQHTR